MAGKIENLKPFGPDNPPPGKGRPKGSPNRATVFKRLLKLKVEVDNPSKPDEKLSVPLYEAAALGQIISAMKGNHNAWKEIQDSLHGKQVEKTDLTSNGKDVLTSLVVKVIK